MTIDRRTAAHKSSMATWDECPSQWYAKYILGLQAPSRASRIGTVCHRAAEAIAIAHEVSPGRKPHDIARESIATSAAEGLVNPGEMIECYEIMDRVTSEDSNIRLHVPPRWTVRAEAILRLGADFNPVEDGPYHYGGVLDRLMWGPDGSVEVWDFKTTLEWIRGEELQHSLEAQWYVALASRYFPQAETIRFRLVNLRSNYVASWNFTINEDFIARMKARADLYLSQSKQASDPDAPREERIGSHCVWCPVADTCRSARQARAIRGLDGMDRVQMARYRSFIRKMADEVDKTVRDEVKANGPIDMGNGNVLAEWPTSRVSLTIDRRLVPSILQGVGVTDLTPLLLSNHYLPNALQKVLSTANMSDAARKRVFESMTTKGLSAIFEERSAS